MSSSLCATKDTVSRGPIHIKFFKTQCPLASNYCPVCHKCYEENDYESKMVQCYKCNRWVHATCDSITDEAYEILSCLPETVVYTCIECTIETTPLWKKAIREYLKHGLKSVLNSLLTSRCARHLIKQTESSSNFFKIPNDVISSRIFENNRNIDPDKISVSDTDFNRNYENYLPKEENHCHKMAVEETVSSLIDRVHSGSSLASEKIKNNKNISQDHKNVHNVEIPKLENNCFQSLERNSSSQTIKDIQQFHHQDLLTIKVNLDKGKYKTISSFFDDIIEIIEVGNDMGMKHHTSAVKAILIKQTEKIFPWYKVPTAKVWRSKRDIPEGMLPNAVVPPSLDHIYAHYLNRIPAFPALEVKEESQLPDNRICVLCNYSGDSQPKKCGRLLYCGQDDWIHVNCAVWSAEVFQQPNGSLRNVYPAMSRGKLMHCEFCNQLGATVGCCVRGCPANYHFYCARKDEAVLQADRKVFCALHKDNVDEKVFGERDFPFRDKAFVNQAGISPKWVKKKWEAPMDKDSLHIVIGIYIYIFASILIKECIFIIFRRSLTVNKLGHLTPLSNNKNVLIPVDYECTRIFWSTKNPHIRVKYTCRIIEMKPENSPNQTDMIANTTTVHSPTSSNFTNNNIKLPDEKIPVRNTQQTSDGKNLKSRNCEAYEDSNIIHCVEKLLCRLIKKVAKNESKNKLYVKCDKKNNVLELKSCKDHNSEVSRNSNHPNDVSLEKHKIQFPRFNGNRKNYEFEKLQNCGDCDKNSYCRDRNIKNAGSNIDWKSKNCEESECDKKSYLRKSNYGFNNLSNHKNTLQTKNCNDVLRNSKKTYEFKKYRKRIKSLNEKEDLDSDKLLKLLHEKQLTKEEYERVLQQCGGISSISPKMKSLLNSVVPSHSVSQTVLPVFGMAIKEVSAITESSGYSSNEDNHLRQSSLSSSLPDPSNARNKTFGNVSLAPMENSEVLESTSSWKKDMKFNGKIFNSDSNRLNPNSSSKNDFDSNSHQYVPHVSIEKNHLKEKSLNGMCQNKGPFKCSKCKRLYRTSESFKKHSETCNFIIDSSSGDDESDSSVSSKKSSEDSSFEQIPQKRCKSMDETNDINSNNVNGPTSKPLCEDNILGLKKIATVQVRLPSLNGPNSVTQEHTKNTSDKNYSNQSFKSKQEFESNNSITKESFTSVSAPTNNPVSGQNLLPTQNENFVLKTVPSNERIIIPSEQTLNSSVNIDCNPINPQRVMSNVAMDISSVPLVTENVPTVFNCGYNAPNNIIPMPCNTLIIPPTPSTVPQSDPILSQITVPQTSFLQSPIDLNQSSQLSYIGSITITNNETMSLAVNVPDQIVPVFPQQDINFGVIPNPIQMHQPSEIHLSTVNVQHISVQSSFSSNAVNQLMFPQQTVPFPQNQVMFVEDPVAQHISQAQQPPNYVFHVPMDQTQNCAFTPYVPQQEIQPQFLNQFAFGSNAQQISSQGVRNNYQPQNPVLQRTERLSQTTVLPNQLSSGSGQMLTNRQNNLPENSVFTKAPSTKPLLQSVARQSPIPTDISNRSSPASDQSNNSKNCIPGIKVASNSNIVDILKKAAEQMLNIQATMAKKDKDKSEPVTPEKKTRFAHTRKVAARKAEKLKQKNAVSNGQMKPKSIQLNILKPAFSIPFVPMTAPPAPKNIPCSTAEEAQSSKLLTEKKNDITMPELQPEEASKSTTESNSDIYCYNDDESDEDSPFLRMYMEQTKLGRKEESPPKDKPYLMYEIDSEDGLHVRSRNLRDAWLKVYDELQDARIATHMKQITLAPEDVNGLHMFGLDNPALMYLLEQLPGAECCPDYEFLFHQPAKEIVELPENATGCARSEGFDGRREYDMFNFLASEHRSRPVFLPPEEEEEGSQKSSRRAVNFDLPIAMRFRFLKTVARETVGVYRSSIHGRGLFCKRNIDPGELVIEYAGEVIRSVLTDKRERIYQSKGIGCYMFRIDDDEVVDATMHGNAARFINHSCEPNCFSKVITVDGKKHIVIFALRRIIKGEELTYDYKFPFEDEKIPCHCNSRRCRKYLN
ncbi:UNVERIFIED_CONTAM: Kmt2a [Trichonephila clavipes]